MNKPAHIHVAQSHVDCNAKFLNDLDFVVDISFVVSEHHWVCDVCKDATDCITTHLFNPELRAKQEENKLLKGKTK